MLILKKLKTRIFTFSFALFLPFSTYATVVEVRTVLGNIQVNLFDETTPATVANFLEYVNSGAYANNIVHRVEPGFVVQAGGFQSSFDAVPTGTPVTNEPALSNVRGTIAMAKLGSSPNSATSQWFFNLADNGANLDVQNGGFTVFGQVIGDGMQVVDAIAAIDRYNQGGAFTSLPLIDYDGSSAIAEANIVLITDVVVVDYTTATNTQLNPATNTRINASSGGSSSPSSGGGSAGWLLALLAFVCLGRRKLS